MRWDPADEDLRGFASDNYWEPRILNKDMIAGAQGDRTLWNDAMTKIAGFDSVSLVQSQAWADSVKRGLATQATGSLGLPAGLTSTIGASLGMFAMQPAGDLKKLAINLAKTAIGITCAALAAVPIVNAVAAAIGALAFVVIDLKTKDPVRVKEFFPPVQVYEPKAEEWAMNMAIYPALSTKDWTNLFVPALGSKLTIERREDNLGAWILGSDNVGGVGFIPGSQQICRQTQARFVYKSDRGGDRANHEDIGSFFPSVAQLLTSVSGQVQSSSASLYSVKVSKIRNLWSQHVSAVEEFLTDLWNGKGIKGTGLESLTENQRHVIVAALAAPFYTNIFNGKVLRGVLVSWSPGSSYVNIYDGLVKPWCDAVEKRQEHFLDTTACAYIAPGSPLTFEQVRTMRRNRRLLLESPARYKVDLDDVIDDEYRKELFSATIGQTLVAPTSSENTSSDPVGIDNEPPPPPPPPEDTKGGPAFQLPPREPQSGLGGVAALAALGGAALVLRKRRRKR